MKKRQVLLLMTAMLIALSGCSKQPENKTASDSEVQKEQPEETVKEDDTGKVEVKVPYKVVTKSGEEFTGFRSVYEDTGLLSSVYLTGSMFNFYMYQSDYKLAAELDQDGLQKVYHYGESTDSEGGGSEYDEEHWGYTEYVDYGEDGECKNEYVFDKNTGKISKLVLDQGDSASEHYDYTYQFDDEGNMLSWNCTTTGYYDHSEEYTYESESCSITYSETGITAQKENGEDVTVAMENELITSTPIAGNFIYGNTAEIEYNENGLPQKISTKLDDGTEYAVYEFTYNDKNKIATSKYNEGGSTREVTYEYGDAGEMTSFEMGGKTYEILYKTVYVDKSYLEYYEDNYSALFSMTPTIEYLHDGLIDIINHGYFQSMLLSESGIAPSYGFGFMGMNDIIDSAVLKSNPLS